MKILLIVVVLAMFAGCVPSGDPVYPSVTGRSPGLSSATAVCKYGVTQIKDANGTIRAHCRTWAEYQSLKARALWDKASAAVVKELTYAWEKDKKRFAAPPCKWSQPTPIGPVCHR